SPPGGRYRGVHGAAVPVDFDMSMRHVGKLANKRQRLRGARHLGLEPFQLCRLEPRTAQSLGYLTLYRLRWPVGWFLPENALDDQGAVVVVGQGLEVLVQILKPPIGVGSIEEAGCCLQTASRGTGRSK